MSRILLRLVLIVPLLIGLTLALEAYGRILPPTPDALLDVCPMPCVLGVTPNTTHQPDIENILSFTLPADFRTITQSVALGNVQYNFETLVGGQYVSGAVALYATDDRVESITLTTQFPLTTLMEKWGAPDCVDINIYDGAFATGVLDWQGDNYFAQALFVFQQPQSDWTTASVQWVGVYGVSGGCSGMQEWRGFAPLWRYQ